MASSSDRLPSACWNLSSSDNVSRETRTELAAAVITVHACCMQYITSVAVVESGRCATTGPPGHEGEESRRGCVQLGLHRVSRSILEGN
jgi:hypothetical protein